MDGKYWEEPARPLLGGSGLVCAATQQAPAARIRSRQDVVAIECGHCLVNLAQCSPKFIVQLAAHAPQVVQGHLADSYKTQLFCSWECAGGCIQRNELPHIAAAMLALLAQAAGRPLIQAPAFGARVGTAVVTTELTDEVAADVDRGKRTRSEQQ